MSTTWVCLMCGKVSKDRYGKVETTPGWDVSCFVNSVQVKEDYLVWKDERVVEIKDDGVVDWLAFKDRGISEFDDLGKKLESSIQKDLDQLEKDLKNIFQGGLDKLEGLKNISNTV